MLDIKGQVVNIGDRVLVSSKYHGLVLTTFEKESKTHYYFGDNVERLAKFIKGTYVGSKVYNLQGQEWDHKRDGRYNYSPPNFIHKGLGTNGGRYILKDMTNEKQIRVLKVDNNFSL